MFVSNLETENLNKSNLKNKTPGSDQGAYLTDDFEWDHFTIKLKQIGHFALSQTGRADYFHLQKIQWFGYFLLASSFGLILLFDHHLVTNNLFLISTNWDKTILIICGSVLMSLYLMTRWLLMHHVGHGGYDRIKNIPSKYNSKKYALGWRRFIDWFDWIQAEAWNYEHNYLHHYFTGEEKDPDLVERNLEWLANSKIPILAKYGLILFFMMTWKFTYYSARTLSYLKGNNQVDFSNFFDIRKKSQQTMWFQLFIPYILFHFVFLTGVFGFTYLKIRILAELIHNMHTFLVIIPNHSGPDVYRFQSVNSSDRNLKGFYLRQILGSANFNTGSEWLDFSQMYLNYQIEHHLFPNLSMLQYRRIQPLVKQLCLDYGIPYVQESVWKRFYKMTQIAVGSKKMLKL